MKLLILPGTLKAALDVATSTVSTRSQVLPILSHVLLDATPDGGLTVTGTDLESRSHHTVSCRTDEAGSVALPPKELLAFLEAVPASDAIALTVTDAHKAELVCGRTRMRVAGFDPEEFPAAPDFDEPSADLTLGADALALLVKSVAHAVAPADSRPELTGILLRAEGGSLTATAADGFRLAVRSVAVDETATLDCLPLGKTLVKAAGKLGSATSARLLVDANRSHLLVDSEAGCWATRLIEGQYPDFRRIIPTDPPVVVTLDRSDLQRAMRLIRSVAEEHTTGGQTYRTVTARLTVTSDSLELRARGSNGNQEAEVVLPATLERGDGMTVAFNGAYLRDAVEAIDDERVTLELVGPVSPAILRPASGDGEHRQIVMPMHVAR